MGFFDRLMGKIETAAPIKVAVIGDGPEADALAKAYQANESCELAAAEALDNADRVIAMPGLAAVEIVAPPGLAAKHARAAISAGLMTSLSAPDSADELDELYGLSQKFGVPLRVRLLPLYYPPFAEMKRLVDEDTVGPVLSLKLAVKRGKGSELPDPFDPAVWVRDRELGFLALAQWLVGGIEKVHARLEAANTKGAPASSVITWKYKQKHCYGYLQLDVCPGLHVRTFDDPVHHSIELTGLGGVIMATRGEGQLMRMPALLVRGKSTTTAFEMVPDQWSDAHAALAAETVTVLQKGGKVSGKADLAKKALNLADLARESSEKGDEVSAA